MYSAQVLEHLKNPRNVGELADASATVEVSNPACGDILRLSVRVTDGRFAAARFKVRGCATSIACGSWLAEWLEGKSPDDARSLTYEEISDALGGLPPATMHGAQLARDALDVLLAKL